jgi:hypothetical protein
MCLILITVIPLAYYFIVNENIYQSSDIYSIIASRMVSLPPHPPALQQTLTVQLSASHSLRSALQAVQTLHQQQKDTPLKPSQNILVKERETEMIQALQSTLRVLQNERTRQTTEQTRVVPPSQQGKRSERESASPVEIKSPKARRRKSKAGGM